MPVIAAIGGIALIGAFLAYMVRSQRE